MNGEGTEAGAEEDEEDEEEEKEGVKESPGKGAVTSQSEMVEQRPRRRLSVFSK